MSKSPPKDQDPNSVYDDLLDHEDPLPARPTIATAQTTLYTAPTRRVAPSLPPRRTLGLDPRLGASSDTDLSALSAALNETYDTLIDHPEQTYDDILTLDETYNTPRSNLYAAAGRTPSGGANSQPLRFGGDGTYEYTRLLEPKDAPPLLPKRGSSASHREPYPLPPSAGRGSSASVASPVNSPLHFNIGTYDDAESREAQRRDIRIRPPQTPPRPSLAGVGEDGYLVHSPISQPSRVIARTSASDTAERPVYADWPEDDNPSQTQHSAVVPPPKPPRRSTAASQHIYAGIDIDTEEDLSSGQGSGPHISNPTLVASASPMSRLSAEDAETLKNIATDRLEKLRASELREIRTAESSGDHARLEKLRASGLQDIKIAELSNDFGQQKSFLALARARTSEISSQLEEAEKNLTPIRRGTLSRALAFAAKPKEKGLEDDAVKNLSNQKQGLNFLTAHLLPVIAFIKSSIVSSASADSPLLLSAAENVERTLFSMAIGDLIQDRPGLNEEARNIFFTNSCKNLKAIASMISRCEDKKFYTPMLLTAVDSKTLTAQQKTEVRSIFPDLLQTQVMPGSFVSAAERLQSASTPYLASRPGPSRGTSAPFSLSASDAIYDGVATGPAPRPAPSVPGAPSPSPYVRSHNPSPAQTPGQRGLND